MPTRYHCIAVLIWCSRYMHGFDRTVPASAMLQPHTSRATIVCIVSVTVVLTQQYSLVAPSHCAFLCHKVRTRGVPPFGRTQQQFILCLDCIYVYSTAHISFPLALPCLLHEVPTDRWQRFAASLAVRGRPSATRPVHLLLDLKAYCGAVEPADAGYTEVTHLSHIYYSSGAPQSLRRILRNPSPRIILSSHSAPTRVHNHS
jgi:hypothetical protein